jgi:uncharacterized protein YjbI with pentapeptide repeats
LYYSYRIRSIKSSQKNRNQINILVALFAGFLPLKNLGSPIKNILRSIKTTNYQELAKAIQFAFDEVTERKYLELVRGTAVIVPHLYDRGYNLCFTNMFRTNQSEANLTGVNLVPAHLSEANLTGTNLIKADLQYARLSGANLQNANLNGANLQGSNLSEANLQNANLSEAKLQKANFFGAIMPNGEICNQHNYSQKPPIMRL